MVATPLAQTARYIDTAITKCYYLPAVANINAPSRAELDAGTDLSPEVAATTGWSVTGAETAAPDLASTFDSKVPGKTSTEDSSITFYMDKTAGGAEVLDLFPRDTVGFIAWLHGGDIATNPLDCYPIRVRSQPKVIDVTGGTASQVRVDYSVTSEPSENVAVPAAV